MKHVIEYADETDGRSYWQCDCGAAGSVNPEITDVEIAAEKHVGPDEPVSYRTQLSP